MKTFQGIMYFQGTNGRWYVNHPESYCGGYKDEAAAKRFINQKS